MSSILKVQLPATRLGLHGIPPPFFVAPRPPGSRHLTYSIDGNPNIKLYHITGFNTKPVPSRLDERDVNNHNAYKSLLGRRYMDNPPQ